MRAVAAGLQLPVGPAERRLVRERAQQFVMAAAGLVRDREDGIDDNLTIPLFVGFTTWIVAALFGVPLP